MAKQENKTKQTDDDVNHFLSQIRDVKKQADCLQINHLMQKITGEDPKMWGNSIVGFGLYHYKYESGREGDFMKIGFSPRAQNITLYIMGGFDRYQDLLKRLGKFNTGKSCLYIKKIQDIDWQVLEELCTESYRFMSEKYG